MSLNGVLLVDKPAGITSHDVVSIVRKAFNIKSVGHAGTLDPFATGLLILLIGEATKISDYLRDGDKSYITEVKLGVQTDTLDNTGQVVSESLVDLSFEQIKSAVDRAQGALELNVPRFSAVKVQGQKLYNKARQNEVFETPKRVMHFYNVQLLEAAESTLKVSLSCKKGGYIRAWGSYIGELLKCGGHLTTLRRTESSHFKIENSTSVEALKAMCGESLDDKALYLRLKGSFMTLENCLNAWPTVTIKGKNETLLLNGQVSHDLNRRLIVEQKKAIAEGITIGVRVLSGETGRLLCLLEARPDSGLKIRRVFKPK